MRTATSRHPRGDQTALYLFMVLAMTISIRLVIRNVTTIDSAIPEAIDLGMDSPAKVSFTSPSLHVIDSAANFNNQIYIPLPSSPNKNNNLWEESTLIPDWLKEYFAWHQQERARLTESNWKDGRYLLPVAPRISKSGGMTDRIRPLPAYLRLAAQTKRLLMIYWERPCALEEFLLPPKGGLDWRVPPFMLEQVQRFGNHFSNWTELGIVATSNESNRTILTSQYQSWNYGELVSTA